jgi:hypothetical protein
MLGACLDKSLAGEKARRAIAHQCDMGLRCACHLDFRKGSKAAVGNRASQVRYIPATADLRGLSSFFALGPIGDMQEWFRTIREEIPLAGLMRDRYRTNNM